MKEKICSQNVVQQTKKHLFRGKPHTLKHGVYIALKAAHGFEDKMNSHLPRVVRISKC